MPALDIRRLAVRLSPCEEQQHGILSYLATFSIGISSLPLALWLSRGFSRVRARFISLDRHGIDVLLYLHTQCLAPRRS